ncbi:MAG: FAD-dependent oxidoreductase [Bacteriovoracaceae bacterium]|nr:FAD-dependent oxidoreductase [Bacteriovoracaceae bacterium]
MKTPIGNLDPATRVVHIWGAGVAGLLMGHFLSRQGFYVHIYEKSDRIGGKIQSERFNNSVLEAGPNAIYATEEIKNWLKELKLEIWPATKKLKRKIWDNKPISPQSFKLLLRILTRIFLKSPPITDSLTVADFFRPLLGSYVENLLSPALQGIYACGANELTVTSIWPQLKQARYFQVLKQLKGPRAESVSFPGGMEDFISALAQNLNGKIHLNSQEVFTLKTNTILCTEAYSAAHLLEKSWPQGSKYLSEINYLPVSSVKVLSSTPNEAKRTFGYLFTTSSEMNSLGVLFNEEIFPQRAGLTFILSGTHETQQRVSRDLKRLNWPQAEMKENQWEHGLPCYNERRTKAIKNLRSDPLRPKNLVLFGNYVDGISIRDMILCASSFAKQFKLQSSPGESL